MQLPMLVDSHCHLDYADLAKDREGAVTRAKAAGVGAMVNISTTRKGFDQVRATAEEFAEVYCSVGVHPHHVDDEGENLSADDIVALTQHPKVIGIGETGLDYFYEHGARAVQAASFRRHIQAGIATGLPIIIHSRDAEADTTNILKEEGRGQNGKLRGLLHCFSSKRMLAEEALALGFYVSLSGILTFKKSEELRETVKYIPLDRLLVETDSPYLAPLPYRGKPCEPAYVVHTAKVLAEIKQISFDEIARITTENFFRLFQKAQMPAAVAASGAAPQ